MPIPSFAETLGSALGPGITVIEGGDIFGGDEKEDAAHPLSVDRMNKEISFSSTDDDLVFIASPGDQEDPLLRAFLETRENP